MDRNDVDWRGYIPALTTPFRQDASLDEDAVRALHGWALEQGLHGVIVLGTQGEWFSLSREEKDTLMRITAEQLRGSMTILAGCHAFTAAEVIQNIETAAGHGFDGALVTPPPYVKPQEEEIYAFYADVDAGSALPICVYNWPPGTNVDMSPALLGRLAELDKVVAIKNSTADLRRFLEAFFALKDSVRVFGIPMNELGITLVKEHNADGTMGAGAVLGSDHPAFFEAAWAGDLDRAREMARRDEFLMRRWFNPDYTGKFGSAQAIFKEALNAQGLAGGHTRRPILPISSEGAKVVRDTLQQLGKL